MARSPHVVVDHVDDVVNSIRKLSRTRVYVGIPATTPPRSDTTLTNAVIGYLMEHGIPERNVPARPFLVPGVRSVQDKTTEGLKRAAQYSLDGHYDQMLRQMGAVGLTAVSAVRGVIQARIPPPLAARTVQSRLRKTQAGRRRLRNMQKAGTDLYKWGAANLTPLIDTGNLRNSITYVIR
jgi:hypothetical protein